MIRFLIKGILRDKNRSLLPVVIVSIGVLLTVFLSGYIRGVMGDMIDLTARFQTGHLKVMSKAYADNQDQMPNDLALVDLSRLLQELKQDNPKYDWKPRIHFGGLVDVPGPGGETRSQGPGTGLAFDLLSPGSSEIDRLNIQNSLVRGALPATPGEALLSEDFAQKLGVQPGETITFFGSTMNGAMAFRNFTVSGTVKFGSAAMDRGTLIADLGDAQAMLDMDNSAGEIVGYHNAGAYEDEDARSLAAHFNKNHADGDEFEPVMQTLGQQNNMGAMLQYTDHMAAIFVGIFVFAMSLVLWNTGLLGGLRRYQEFGIRLALGESKGAIYRSLFTEAVIIGLLGSIAGTTFGVLFCFLLQKYGIDISSVMQDSSMMYPNRLRARMSLDLFVIGFIPGLFSMVLGNLLAGIGIYKRETAQLFKELEV